MRTIIKITMLLTFNANAFMPTKIVDQLALKSVSPFMAYTEFTKKIKPIKIVSCGNSAAALVQAGTESAWIIFDNNGVFAGFNSPELQPCTKAQYRMI
jgi:hypothetical protein